MFLYADDMLITFQAKNVDTMLTGFQDKFNTVHFGYSGHLWPPLSGHYIRLATISDLNIIE